ncbi:glutaredoxin [Parasitella parasitica]|nr:glutaredoxin [Parasitella parasitica]
MTNVEQFVEDTIKNNKVAIFTKSTCEFCRKAKTLLDGYNIKYENIELDKNSDGEAIQEYLTKKTGQKTVPNIFMNQKHIGDSHDLTRLEGGGELQGFIA